MTELFTIKPLVWEWTEKDDCRKYEARCLEGVFRVLNWREHYRAGEPYQTRWILVIAGGGGTKACASAEEGKALAEQHWREYISQALERVPTEPATKLSETEWNEIIEEVTRPKKLCLSCGTGEHFEHCIKAQMPSATCECYCVESAPQPLIPRCANPNDESEGHVCVPELEVKKMKSNKSHSFKPLNERYCRTCLELNLNSADMHPATQSPRVCECLMPLGSKTCHHCKLSVRQVEESK